MDEYASKTRSFEMRKLVHRRARDEELDELTKTPFCRY